MPPRSAEDRAFQEDRSRKRAGPARFSSQVLGLTTRGLLQADACRLEEVGLSLHGSARVVFVRYCQARFPAPRQVVRADERGPGAPRWCVPTCRLQARDEVCSPIRAGGACGRSSIEGHRSRRRCPALSDEIVPAGLRRDASSSASSRSALRRHRATPPVSPRFPPALTHRPARRACLRHRSGG